MPDVQGALGHAVGFDHSVWTPLDRLRGLHGQEHHVGRPRLPAHAGDLGRGPRRGAGLPSAPIHDHRGRRRRRVHHPRPAALVDGRHRLRDRRDPVRLRGLHRHERLGAGERAHGPGGDEVARRRPRHRLPLGRSDRPSGRRTRAARRRRLFRLPDGRSWLCARRPHRSRRAGRARLRRLADLDLRPSRRRHLHQGRRRRGRPRRQGRSRHPRGRSAQPGDHRRQRRRQRRRLRRAWPPTCSRPTS